KINVFAKMDHPRGLFYDHGSLWVLHPPFLTVYHDDNLDGVADREETLITGISSEETKRRGADHTTNGIRLGIDGWLYIAVGDFGFTEAKGKDGTVLARRGGGVVRVRLDGTGMEIFSWGQRNIVDICVDPYLNLYTRDNTNDGGGWDIRLSHVIQSGLYGYPSLYLNFTGESLPPLKDYGGGSGCGAMYFQDLRWPKPYADALYTCDWGTSTVYRHNLPANGATFDAHQEVFLKLPRPTDMDVDGSGRLYVTSWKNGKFNFSGPNVGFVTQVTPAGFTPKPFKPLHFSSEASLLGHLSSPSAVHRLHSQRELVRRGKGTARIAGLSGLAADARAPLYGRIAAIYTLKQILGTESNAALFKLLDDASIREAALRALTDDKAGLDKLPLQPFLLALEDENPRVRAQALISLGRLGRSEAGKAILPFTQRPSGQPAPTAKPLYKQADPGRVIPHLAVRALESCNAVKACLDGIEGPYSDGAFWALKYLHNEETVSGLAGSLSRTQNTDTRREILTTLVRLYHREGDYKGGWWGTRPDRTGPYYDRKPWSESDKIAATLKTFLAGADAKTLQATALQLARHKVKIAGLPSAAAVAARAKEAQSPIVVPRADPKNPNLVANIKPEAAAARALKAAGDAKRGEALFKLQTCISCHTTANGQLPKGPHLVDIGKRYKKAELIESILKPSAKIAQGFDTYVFVMKTGKAMTGFVTSESADEVELRQTNGISSTITRSAVGVRRKSPGSVMPVGLVNSLTPEQLADLVAYLQSL
ncbi:MAG: c-type cytochrome, partial [Planctomycetota bacterium]